MKKRSLLLCDSDPAYVRALSQYLASAGYAVTTYTGIDPFAEDRKPYDLTLLSPDFIECAESFRMQGQVFALVGSGEEAPAGTMPLYKFQAMDSFLAKLSGRTAATGLPRIITVCSPIYHELRLPFALALARIYGEQARTLFIDLEEASILGDLLAETLDGVPTDAPGGFENGPDLIDLIYRLESSLSDEGSESALPEDCVFSYEGFSYLPPAADPLALSEVTKEQWGHLMQAAGKSAFEVLVVLSDHLPGHFAEWYGENAEVILLSKRGDYYRKSERKVEEYLSERLPDVALKEVDLPMSAANLSDGTWYLPSLLDGNLGRFVRDRFGVREGAARG